MKPCRNCEHPIRPIGAKAADYPGTKGQQARGLCWACYRNPDRVLDAPQYPRPCARCDVSMRPASSNPTDYPTAETAHAGHGLCKPCYMKDHDSQRRPRAALTDQHHEYNVRTLESFMSRIRGKSRVKA